jgi:hypothetical protein
MALGSGVIIDAAKGYVVTNNHVVDNATMAKRRTLERRTVLAERRVIAKELLEVTWHPWGINGGATFNVNAHHRRHHLLQHRGQAWHLLCIRRNFQQFFGDNSPFCQDGSPFQSSPFCQGGGQGGRSVEP